MAKRKKLATYLKKRNFKRTSEPKGRKATKRKRPVFVIQKHDASHLHYDFRLEIDGVLKSWAVPKGPSTNPKEKRLAILTEDHPVAYADFEGVIPEEEYGGGTVMIWDRGSFKLLKKEDGKSPSLKEAFKNGHLTVSLKGKKLKGGFALIRTGKKKKERWMLIKMDDDQADARRNPVSSQPKSVVSGMTLKQIEKKAKEKE